MTRNAIPHIVVAGGGVAAMEFVLALHAVAEGRYRLSIVTPDPELTLRPLELAGLRTLSLSEFAAEIGAQVVRGSVALVEPLGNRVVLSSGDALRYDTLVLALGVTSQEAFDEALHLGFGDSRGQLAALHEEIHAAAVSSVAFVSPTSTGWLVPLYEAALLTAGRGGGVALTLVTPEKRPLQQFGEQAGELVARALQDAGVEFRSGQVAAVQPGELTLLDGATVSADRVVAVPLVHGKPISGIPAASPLGLIPVDAWGCVSECADVYAIGDATDFPVKQVAVACAQADVAAAHIAAGRGWAGPAEPFRPDPRATLLDHRGEQLLLNGGQGEGKLPGRHLGPFLQAHLTASA